MLGSISINASVPMNFLLSFVASSKDRLGVRIGTKGVERDFLRKRFFVTSKIFTSPQSITLESVASTFGVEKGLEFIAALSDPIVTVKVAVASAPNVSQQNSRNKFMFTCCVGFC